MNKYAVLIGNSQFPSEQDKKKLPDLKCPENDVDGLEKLLINGEKGNFLPENVSVLKNKTSVNIIEAIEEVFNKATKDDLILIYYSGHGVQVGTPVKLFLTAYNTILNRPVSTAISIAQLREIMDIKVSHKKIILILDCCYSGDAGKNFAFKGSIDAELDRQLAEEAKGIYLLTSAGSTVAWEHEHYSLFTKYLIEGIETGDADLDQDGDIDIDELFDYIRPRVEQDNAQQKPRKYGIAETGGKLIIAKSGRDARADRAEKIADYLYDLAKEKRISRDILKDAVDIIEKPVQQLSELEKTKDKLISDLFAKKDAVSFIRAWDKLAAEPTTDEKPISSIKPPHNEPIVPDNKPSKQQLNNQDQYGRYVDLTVNNVTQRLRWIAAGSFSMGSPLNEPERRNDETQHPVTLTQGYWLADTACTQALWQAVMGNNPANFQDDLNNPVEQVSWNDVQAFLGQLNQLRPDINARLPTEAEWEYACRAGTTTPFSFGDNITPEQVNYDGNYPYNKARKGLYRKKTVAVKSLPANPWGLYEMHGNVWEWCVDWYGDYPNKAVTNPTGAPDDTYRVLRGGSWLDDARYTRSAIRSSRTPDSRFSYAGFRFALGQTA